MLLQMARLFEAFIAPTAPEEGKDKSADDFLPLRNTKLADLMQNCLQSFTVTGSSNNRLMMDSLFFS